MKLIQLNMNNLTALWALAGKAAGTYIHHDDYAISLILNSEWPNKLWFHTKPGRPLLDKIIEKHTLHKITIPLWGTELHETEAMLYASGFKMKNVLTGMSLFLDGDFKPAQRLFIDQVHNRQAASSWSGSFQKAFGYLIHPDTVDRTMNKVCYFRASYHNQPVGTAVLYIDKMDVAGIHSMGILPDHRRKGFAEELLLHLLNIARQKGAKYATLQASEMGKGLYQRIGFNNDFQLKNFIK
ncbi:MAG: GNAT family N-acetyltransferase [Candidatus Cyclobacteriaceae bacterium M3_2C_046]